MLLKVDKKSNVTVFQQVFRQITELINCGALAAGSRLPSTRELAKTIGVNRSTIIRVYEELWVQGFTESSPGSYTTIRKRHAIVAGSTADNGRTGPGQDIYRDNLGLKYDLMMHYLENGQMLEKGKINFLQLSPDTRLLNRKQIKTCMRDVLNETESNPFGFTHARGYPPLRHEIARQMKLHHIHADDKNVLVTNGSLQSLQLIFQVFSRPGDYIAIESPANSIILLFVQIFGLRVIEIPMTEDGMDLKVLEVVQEKTPLRFIYLMPTYQNPTGISMPQHKREEFLQLCRDKDCVIIEDSIEEELNYSGKAHLPLKSIDRNGQVIYLGTFAKILAPGLRIGWLIASPECIKKITVLKSVFEISSGTINQMFLYNFFRRGAFELHLRKTMRVFKKRMKVAVDSIKKYVPQEKIEWTAPNGGYMIWIKLLTGYLDNIEGHFSEYGVLVHNGRYFSLKEQPYNYIRICIAQVNEIEIEEGIQKMGAAIRSIS